MRVAVGVVAVCLWGWFGFVFVPGHFFMVVVGWWVGG